MAFWDFLTGRKKKRKTTMQRAIQKPKEKKRAAREEGSGLEDPVISFSKQLTNVQRDVEEIQSTLLSGFRGLREDHHKIMEQQTTKSDFLEFKKYLEEKKAQLERIREETDRELEMLDIDKKIVQLITKRKMRAAEVARELKISRQYAAMRLSELTKYNIVEQKRKGREVYYSIKK